MGILNLILNFFLGGGGGGRGGDWGGGGYWGYWVTGFGTVYRIEIKWILYLYKYFVLEKMEKSMENCSREKKKREMYISPLYTDKIPSA